MRWPEQRWQMRAAASLAIGLLVALTAWGTVNQDGYASGDALEPSNRSWFAGRHYRPGEEWILMLASLRNRSDRPVTIWDVDLLASEGLGESVEPVRIELAPLPGTSSGGSRWEEALNVTGGGLFKTYPPADQYEEGAVCHVQELKPVEGFVLPPDAEARIMVWLRAVAEGRFRIDGHRVIYENGGNLYGQDVLTGQRGRVSAGGPPGLPLANRARDCVRQGVADALPDGPASVQA